MALASDANNQDFVGATDPDARLYVEFYNNPVHNEFKSNQEGRPIFEDVIFVKIVVPGDNSFNINSPANDGHKARFPHHWARFKNAHDSESRFIGTPLSQWPLLTPSAVEELKYMKFHTVEQIAGGSDSQLNGLGMKAGYAPLALRERAKQYLEVASGEADLNSRTEEIKKLKDEQAEKDAKHEASISELKEQMATLIASMNQPVKENTLHLKKA